MNILYIKNKIKILVLFFVFLLLSFFSAFSAVFAQSAMDGYKTSDMFSERLDTVVNDQISSTEDISDPLRQGAFKIIHGKDSDKKVKGILYNDKEITGYDDAKKSTLAIIKKFINYALSLVALVALIYLIYHGFLMLTAVGDDGQYKKGLKGLRTAMIALFGIGLSWLIISFIFWVISFIIG